MEPRNASFIQPDAGNVLPLDMEPKYKPGVAVCRSKMCSNYAYPSKKGLCNACARVAQSGARRTKPNARPIQVLTYAKAVDQHDGSCCKGTAPIHTDFTAEKTALRENYCFGCGFRHFSSHWKMLPRRSSKHWNRWEMAFLPLVAEVSKTRNVNALPGKSRFCPRFAPYFGCYFHGTLGESDADYSAPHMAVDSLSDRARTAHARLVSQRAAEIARETAPDLSSGSSPLHEKLIDDLLQHATEAAELRTAGDLPSEQLAEVEELCARANETGKRGRHALASRVKPFLTFQSMEAFDRLFAPLKSLVEETPIHDRNGKSRLGRRSLKDGLDIIALVVSHVKKLPVEIAAHLFGIEVSTAYAYITRFRPLVSSFLVNDCKLVRFKEPKELLDSLPTGVQDLFAGGVVPAVIFDGTYMYTGTPKWSGLNVQFFCVNKGKHCFKVMIGIHPDGWICFISRPYNAAADDKMLTDLLTRGELDELRKYDDDRFAVVLDRGFRPENMERSKEKAVADQYSGFSIMRPAYLRGESQFTHQEVTQSRVTSSLRTSVETAIGHLKMFHSLGSIWKEHDPDALYHTTLIAAALVNCNFKRVRSDREPGALPVNPIQSESLVIGSDGLIGPAEAVPAELCYTNGAVGKYLITTKNRREGEVERIVASLSKEKRAEYRRLSRRTLRVLKDDLKKRGMTFPSNSVKAELILQAIGVPCRLDNGERLSWADLDTSNCQSLPELTYDALVWAFAVPSTAKKGRSRTDKAKDYLYGTKDIPPRLRKPWVAEVGRHRVLSCTCVASMRGKNYKARAAFLRGDDDSWALRCFCECKNGRSSRCSHVVALLMLASHAQHPDDDCIPWNAEPPARRILSTVRLIKKRAGANAPLEGPLARPVQSKRRKVPRCGLCNTAGHNKRTCDAAPGVSE